MTDPHDHDTEILSPLAPGELSPERADALQDLVDTARERAAQRRAPRTRDEYDKAWLHFVSWAKTNVPELDPGPPTPPGLLALFLANVRTAGGELPSVSVLGLWKSAIDARHKDAGMLAPSSHPQVQQVWDGVRRVNAARPRKASALTVAEVKLLVESTSADAAGRRDRAMILVGWVGALRRSEIIGLTWGRLQRDRDRTGAEALLLDLGRTKGDQEGVAELHPLPLVPGSPLDPGGAVEAWSGDVLHADGGLYADRAVFRAVSRWGKVSPNPLDPASVSRILNRIADKAGIDRSRLSAHSLRAGGITAAADAGLLEMQRLGRHKSPDTTAGYYRPPDEHANLPMRSVLDGGDDDQ